MLRRNRLPLSIIDVPRNQDQVYTLLNGDRHTSLKGLVRSLNQGGLNRVQLLINAMEGGIKMQVSYMHQSHIHHSFKNWVGFVVSIRFARWSVVRATAVRSWAIHMKNQLQVSTVVDDFQLALQSFF